MNSQRSNALYTVKYYKSFEHDTVYLNLKLSIISKIFLVNILPLCFSWGVPACTSIAWRPVGELRFKNVPSILLVDSRACRKCAVHRGSEKCLVGTKGCESLLLHCLLPISTAMPFLIDHIYVVIHWVKHYNVHVRARKYPCCRRSLVAITGGHWLYTALYSGAHCAAKIIL
jgi:hypothetical protein